MHNESIFVYSAIFNVLPRFSVVLPNMGVKNYFIEKILFYNLHPINKYNEVLWEKFTSNQYFFSRLFWQKLVILEENYISQSQFINSNEVKTNAV